MVSIHNTFSMQCWLWKLLLNHILHLHPTCLPFPVIPISRCKSTLSSSVI